MRRKVRGMIAGMTAAVAALVGAPAQAMIYTATFTGLVSRAADFGGLFGPAGTDISGFAFKAVYRVDTAIGQYSSGNAVSAELDSGSSHGQPQGMRATLTINGHTQAISGRANGIVVQENGVQAGFPVIPNGDEVYYEVSGSTGPYNSTQLAFVIADGVASFLDTPDFSAPQEIDFTPTSQQSSMFAIHDNGASAYGGLFATHLSVASAVPDASTYALLLAGFGLIGTQLRRTRTVRAVTA